MRVPCGWWQSKTRQRQPRVQGTRERGGHALPSLVALLDEPGNDAQAGILAVEGVRKLLTRRLVLLLERERLEHERIPLGLERVQQRGHRGRRRRPGSSHVRRWTRECGAVSNMLSTESPDRSLVELALTDLDLHEVLLGQRLARDGVARVLVCSIRLG
jgi:hypothetical protein